MANKPTPAAMPENASSNKSMPAPKSEISADVQKIFRMFVIAAATVAAITFIVSKVRAHYNNEPQSSEKVMRQKQVAMPQSEIPLASKPQSEWPKLTIAAGEKSETLPRPAGMHIVAAGYNFTAYNVYADGNECAFGQSCPEGASGAYVKNDSNAVNIVSYAFVSDQ